MKLTAKEAKPLILQKVNEIKELFDSIEYPEKLALSITVFSHYKSCTLYEKETDDKQDVFYSFVFTDDGYQRGWE